jgi:predicted nucleic acid-binding protein
MSDVESFFDTNVLLYLLSSEDEKAGRVEELLASSGNISVQVLNEFTAVATRKLRMSLEEVREVLDTVRAVCTTHPLTEETYERGLMVVERYRFSLYDSMIVSAALLAGCETLFSEDLQHNQVIDDQLTIVNPFA